MRRVRIEEQKALIDSLSVPPFTEQVVARQQGHSLQLASSQS